VIADGPVQFSALGVPRDCKRYRGVEACCRDESRRMLTLSCVIVSYRVRDLLAACLQSIEQAGFPSLLEVIVVDNASGDGTIETLRPRFPHVRWIQNEQNIGFAPAVNQGAAVASGRYLLLLNPDTILLKGALECLVSFLDSHPAVGVVGPRLLLPDGTPYVSVTKFPTVVTTLLYETRLNRFMPNSRFLRPYTKQLAGEEPFPVDAVEGSCLLTRRRLWDHVQGFDPRYFFGVEEVDYAWKVKQAGYGVWFVPIRAAIHRHAGSTGGKRTGPLILLSVTLGYLHFLRSNKAPAAAFLRVPLLVIWSVKAILSGCLGRNAHRVAFVEGVKALMGVRPAWLTAEDRAHWG